MVAALGEGGTSFDALYVNVNGESGYFDRSLHAYGREDEPCDRCAAPIRRVAFMNRSSYFCPVCQPVPTAPGARAGSRALLQIDQRPSSGTLEDGPPRSSATRIVPVGTSEGSYMAKALIGYMNSDLRDPRLAAENSRLRARVGELEAMILRLSEENDRLVATQAAELLSRDNELQPV